MTKYLITLIALFAFAFSIAAQEEETIDGTLIHVAPYQQDCVGVAPQDCLVVRFEDEDDLSYFYDTIEGFTFEEGFEYTLLVNITEAEDVPADASSLQYELIEVVQQFPAQLAGKVWELQSLNGTEIEEPSRYTFMVNDEGAGLRADCNSVGANLTLNPFDIETTFSTLVACPPDSLESDYVAAINAATMMSIENGELILQSSDGQLRFAPPAIDGTEWTLTRVLGLAMMLELDDTTPYTLLIEDEAVTMTIACNGAGGAIEFEGAVMHFTDIVMTLQFCENDPLAGMYPPETAVYYVTDTGNLVLEDSMGNLYEFSSSETE